MTVQLEPLGARLLVRLRPIPQVGHIIRVNDERYAREADVIAVGPEVRDVGKGDVVVISILAGQKVGDDLLLPESSVLAHVDAHD